MHHSAEPAARPQHHTAARTCGSASNISLGLHIEANLSSKPGLRSCPSECASARSMTKSEAPLKPPTVYVRVWLPGASEPGVAGCLGGREAVAVAARTHNQFESSTSQPIAHDPIRRSSADERGYMDIRVDDRAHCQLVRSDER